MKLIFMGNGPFAVPALQTLAGAGHQISLVVTRPDRPQGKHRSIEPGPVRQAANQLGLPNTQPESANDANFVQCLRDQSADLLVVADFGQILARETLSAAHHGGINIHASLLPKYRGAAPVAWAILQGETVTGVSIIQMTPQLDGGGVILQEEIPILPDETAGELEGRLAPLGALLAETAIKQIQSGTARPIPQDPALVTRAPRLTKEMGQIDWKRSAQQIHDQVRGLIPWPIAYCFSSASTDPNHRLQLMKTRVLGDAGGIPGELIRVEPDRVVVAAGQGGLELVEVKPAGKRAMTAAEFARGARWQVGTVLG